MSFDSYQVFAWGTGPLLGSGSIDATSYAPKVIEELAETRIVDISIGDSTCLALTQDCTVYAWGANTMGQCGLGHCNSPICVPQPVRALYGLPIHQISAGNSHSMAWTTLPTNR